MGRASNLAVWPQERMFIRDMDLSAPDLHNGLCRN